MEPIDTIPDKKAGKPTCGAHEEVPEISLTYTNCSVPQRSRTHNQYYLTTTV